MGEGAADASRSQSSGSGAVGPPQELPRGMGQMPQHNPAFAQVTLPVQDGGTAQRIIHDAPPVWGGKGLDNMAEPYLKLPTGGSV